MRNEKTYDPVDQPDPVHGLTLAIRSLRMGEQVRLPDGTLVKSTVVKRGASNERRFAVVPAQDQSTPVQRHKALVLGHRAYRTAEDAAKVALDKE